MPVASLSDEAAWLPHMRRCCKITCPAGALLVTVSNEAHSLCASCTSLTMQLPANALGDCNKQRPGWRSHLAPAGHLPSQ